MFITTRPKGRPPHLSVRFYRGGKVKCYLNYNRRRIYGGTTPFDVPAELFSRLRPDGRPCAAHCGPDLADLAERLEAFRAEVQAALQKRLDEYGRISRSDFSLATMAATLKAMMKARQEAARSTTKDNQP